METVEQHMIESEKPSLERCLAYVVLENPETWLGEPSTHALDVFLAGATERVRLTGHCIPAWRIDGPLKIPEFYLPVVARTGHPTLTIRAGTALDILHFSLTSAMNELRQLVVKWFDIHGFDLHEHVKCSSGPPQSIHDLLSLLAKRPGMFLGSSSGWALYCYLAGMKIGGDWLGVPPVDGLDEIVNGIAEHSRNAHGSSFGAYRIYDFNPEKLLAWVGISPCLPSNVMPHLP